MALGNDFFQPQQDDGHRYRRLASAVIAVAIIMALAVLGIWGWKAGWFFRSAGEPSGQVGTSTMPGNLGNLPQPGEEDPNASSSSAIAAEDIEFIYFSDFYRLPSQDLPRGREPLALPLNVKTDALNYYDLSRKLALDPVIGRLNQDGFAMIDNPWKKEAPDYYSIFSKLKENDLPLFISSDFLFSYYQRSIQTAYKQIESETFYRSLWAFSQQMYERAKLRYEARLGLMGQVNDPLLEAERAEAAFFATALALLSPDSSQIVDKNLNDKGLFSQEEARRFTFTAVPYIADSVAKEEAAIKVGKTAKSPIFLYDLDYGRFAVPAEYAASEKLRNFYLASRWLNSVFPLNYRSETCPDCLVDKDDWRISFIASQLIVSDIYSDASLKKEWAKVYKMTSYFTGLEDEYDYVKYHAALASAFGDDYQADKIFESRGNLDLEANLAAAQKSILSQPLVGIQGGELTGKEAAADLGLKVLTDYYSASDLIFSALSRPNVGRFLAQSSSKENVTVCAKDEPVRCNGFSLDALSCVIEPIGSAWQENTNYEGYEEARQKLLAKVQQDSIWRNSDYWFSLQLVKDYYASYNETSGGVYGSYAWRERMQGGAQAMWTMSQLPSDEGAIQVIGQAGLAGVAGNDGGLIFEPGLLMVRDMIAAQQMVIDMISALGIDAEAKAATLGLQEAKTTLEKISTLIEKQMSGEDIAAEDEEYVRAWLGGWKVTNPGEKTLVLGQRGEAKAYVVEDISDFKLVIVAQPTSAGTKLFVGPVIGHEEHK